MKIFFSHSSAQKPLVREIRKLLPDHINTWIDEEKLLIGDSIEQSLEKAIKKETDYILLFIDSFSVHSRWVEKEISWTLEQERKLDRVFLLPIVVDVQAWANIKPEIIKERKYLKLADYTENSVRALSKLITSELFSLICRDIQTLRSPGSVTKSSVIDRTDQVLNEIADSIRQVVFGYREAKPLQVDDLHAILKAKSPEYNPNDFETLMRKIIQNDLIPGLVYDGFELYVREEHYKWKGRISADAKRKIAKAAASHIRSGHKIALDAGSTTDELAKILCTRIENKSLFNISIVTTSISAANIFLETGTRLGFDDENSGFRLYLGGGRVRPNTLAVIEELDQESSQLQNIFDQLGGVDFSIIGVNGIHFEKGFTTHSNAEVKNKLCLMKNGKKKLILGDSSKIGIVEEVCFGTFQDDVILITNDGGTDPCYMDLVEKVRDKIQIAK
jgi:DeoR/GlpR family transcriptional regulator of sugar metabolism